MTSLLNFIQICWSLDVHVDAVRRCLWTAATNRPTVHPPGDTVSYIHFLRPQRRGTTLLQTVHVCHQATRSLTGRPALTSKPPSERQIPTGVSSSCVTRWQWPRATGLPGEPSCKHVTWLSRWPMTARDRSLQSCIKTLSLVK